MRYQQGEFMKYALFLIFFVNGILTQDKVKEDKFLDLEVNDSQVQGEIDVLRTDYLSQKKDIANRYNEKIKALKKLQRSDVKSLKKSFREKLKVLREKYKHVKFPEKPKKIKKKDTPNEFPEKIDLNLKEKP